MVISSLISCCSELAKIPAHPWRVELTTRFPPPSQSWIKSVVTNENWLKLLMGKKRAVQYMLMRWESRLYITKKLIPVNFLSSLGNNFFALWKFLNYLPAIFYVHDLLKPMDEKTEFISKSLPYSFPDEWNWVVIPSDWNTSAKKWLLHNDRIELRIG